MKKYYFESFAPDFLKFMKDNQEDLYARWVTLRIRKKKKNISLSDKTFLSLAGAVLRVPRLVGQHEKKS